MRTAERLRRCRGAYNLTQQQLAKQLDVSVRTVEAWEIGRRFPGPSAREALAVVFGRQPSYFKEPK